MMRTIDIFRSSRGKLDIDIQFQLTSITSATFAFSIISALWALIQFFRCIRLMRMKETSSFMGPYIILLFGIIFSFADRTLSAIEIAIDYNGVDDLGEYVPMTADQLIIGLTFTTVDDSNVWVLLRLVPYHLEQIFYVMWNWAHVQADILLALALCVTIIRRHTNTHSPHPAIPRWKVFIDGVLLVSWTSLMIADLVNRNSFLTLPTNLSSYLFFDDPTWHGSLIPEIDNPTWQIHASIVYARLALQLATTVDIAISSLIVWYQNRKAEYSDKNITYIAFAISPCLLVRSIYMIALSTVYGRSLTSETYQMLSGRGTFSSSALDLASVLVDGIFLYVSIHMFLESTAPIPPKNEESEASSSED